MNQLQNRLLHIHAKAADAGIGLAFSVIGSEEGVTNESVIVLQNAMTLAINALGSLRHFVDGCLTQGDRDPLLNRVLRAQNHLMGADNLMASDMHYCASSPLTDAMVELSHILEALDFRVRFTPNDFS